MCCRARRAPQVPLRFERCTQARDEGAQPREELVDVHVSVGDAAVPRGLEVDADAATVERLDGAVCEGRTQEVHLREHCGQPRRRRRVRGQEEAHGLAVVLEDAIGDQAMQVDVEAEVAAEALHSDNDAGVQRHDRGEAVPPLHVAPKVLHQRPPQLLADSGEQVGVLARAAPPAGPGRGG